MEGKSQKIALSLLALLLCACLSAQNKNSQKDSLVRLIKAESLQLMDKDGTSYRKAVKATFFHNNTYLICDTALWNVDRRIINSWGNVKVVQDGTILSSDKMDYLIDDDMVQFRGTLVQLEDKEHNTLRTHFLDYNTRDSLAFFSKGGAMKDKDGQIIESTDGSYDAKRSFFEFRNNVNMFTDSVFIRTTRIDYESSDSRAIFCEPVDFWKEDNMLSADSGWYERLVETFFFNGKVHAMSKEQEAWCDSLYYYRTPNNIMMLGNTQVQDTTRNVSAVANRLFYEDSLRRVTLNRDAAVALRTEEKGTVDTLYIGGDTLVYYTVRKCDIPEGEIKAAESRREEIFSDPISEFRRKAREAREEARRQAEEANAGKNPEMAAREAGRRGKGGRSRPGKASPNDAEEISPVISSEDAVEVEKSPSDTLTTAPVDSLAPPPPPDTTRIGFVEGVGHIKLFRTDLQVVCDSMRFTELDSIARFYINPVVWQDIRNQYSSDSLSVLVKGNGVDRASLMSNAFIITQETATLFDQIRSTEAMAYFDTTSTLQRFDALGGANAIFFLKEKEQFATVNKVECKMLSASFIDGEFDNASYFESAKNDAYPLPALNEADRRMKGFNWQPDLRPKGKRDITHLSVRPSQRHMYEARPKTSFRQTDIYFPGHMKKVYAGLAAAKNKPKVKRAAAPPSASEEISPLSPLGRDDKAEGEPSVISSGGAAGVDKSPSDSLQAAPKDSMAIRDTLAVRDSVALRDSVAVRDSLAMRDSIPPHIPTPAEIRRQMRKEKQAARDSAYQAKIAARDARWAVADSIDAAKAAVKAAQKAEKQKVRDAKKREKLAKQNEDDRRKLEKYVERYSRKYNRKKERLAAKEAKAAQKAAKAPKNPPAAAAPPSEATSPDTEPNTDNQPIENGKDTGQVPEVRQSGHSEQRGFGKPALDGKATELVKTPL